MVLLKGSCIWKIRKRQQQQEQARLLEEIQKKKHKGGDSDEDSITNWWTLEEETDKLFQSLWHLSKADNYLRESGNAVRFISRGSNTWRYFKVYDSLKHQIKDHPLIFASMCRCFPLSEREHVGMLIIQIIQFWEMVFVQFEAETEFKDYT